MNWPFNRSVVLVANDALLLELVAAELREMGCRVFCAADVKEVAELVRAGVTRRFVMIRLGAQSLSQAELRQVMAEETPGWSIAEREPTGPVPPARGPGRHSVN